MDAMKAMLSRRSARAYLNKPVPEKAILDMLEAARHAPSPGNGQGHRFGVVSDRDVIHELAHAAGEQMWIAQAPVVIACCAKIGVPLRDIPEGDFGMEVNYLRFGKPFIDHLRACPDQEAANLFFINGGPSLPMQNIATAATAHGLSTCMIGFLDVRRASILLRLPKDMACLFLMPVGYAAEAPGEKALIDLQEMCFKNRFEEYA